MTACVNKKHSRRVAAAISASLVGALTLGAAPVLAVAEEAPTETQTVEAASAFSKGTVAADVYHGTDKVTDPSKITFDSVKAIKVVPKTINIPGDNEPAYDISDSSVYKVSYYKADKDGKPTGDVIAAPSSAGSYVAVIEATSGHYAGGRALFPFTINAKSMADATPVTVRPDGTTVAINDTNVVYTASEQEIGFELDGKLLTEGVDYTVEYHTAGGDLTDATLIDGAPVDADSYVAVIKGLGNYAGSSADIQKTVKVNPVNLAGCTVENITTDSETLPTMPEAIVLQNGVRVTDKALLDQIELAFKTGDAGDAAGDIMFKDNGQYTFSVKVKDPLNKNFNSTDAKYIQVYKVSELAKWTYDGDTLGNEWKTILKDLKNYPQWSTAEVEASSADGKIVASVEGDYVTKQVYVAGTDTPAADGWSETPGVYDIVLSVDSAKTSYELGGTITVRLTVIEDVLDADASVFVSYDGKVITSLEKDYDGSALSATDFYVELRDADGKPVSGFTKRLVDSEGRTVTSAVNAGSYKLVIESTVYDLTGTTEIPVTINKVDLSQIRSGIAKTWAGSEYIPMNASGITLAGIDVEYLTDKDADGDGELDWANVPTRFTTNTNLKVEKYDAKKGEWVEVTNDWPKLNTEGDYRITVFPATELEAENYLFATDKGTTVTYKVIDPAKLVFTDVAPDAWYFESVYTAQYYKIMNGYGGTKVFGPASPITRGQVAVVLYNMAVGYDATNPSATEDKLVDETSLAYNELFGYDTGFSDVDGKAYYAKAIAWAEQAGVVNGYADGTFHADQEVTRQEFACMLANYAELLGEDVQGAEADLSGFADASQVAPFAEESVEWAVANKVMGNGGSIAPGAWISRAEAAAMAVNYAYAE